MHWFSRQQEVKDLTELFQEWLVGLDAGRVVADGQLNVILAPGNDPVPAAIAKGGSGVESYRGSDSPCAPDSLLCLSRSRTLPRSAPRITGRFRLGFLVSGKEAQLAPVR
jgi:hypothetical protein